MIRIDCYMAVLKKYMKGYPNAIFEIITRDRNHPLSPSWKLLKKLKAGLVSFEQYKNALLEEINNREAAQQKLVELKEISKNHTVFLVCYEKDATKCHRSIIKALVDNQIETGEQMFCHSCKKKVNTHKIKDYMMFKWYCNECKSLLRMKYIPVGS
ncbi:MAG: DUF488 family protein [Candidatus Hodarchaeota archaeon]